MNSHFKPATLLLSTALGLMLFPVAQAEAQTADQPPEANNNAPGEIIVTAQKREESTMDVPMGVTALSGESLANDQAYRLSDFVGQVPGLNVSETQGAQLVIRGIASSAFSINAPVATYIDETPLVGVGAFSGGSSNTPNLDTFDLSRVEVLRGPQGTLYGASALGGLLKYVTNAPDPSGFDASLQLGASTVAHSETIGRNLHGMINVPIGENLAARFVAYDNLYPGYIDDPTRGVEDLDEMHVYGGRGSLLWEATPNFSLRLSVLDQQRRWDGRTYVDAAANTLEPLYCNLCQARDGAEVGESSLRLYNAAVTWDLGAVEFTSSTTYDDWEFRQFQNLIGLNATADFFLGGPAGTWGLMVDFDYWGEDIVHESRLASDYDSFLNWQVGVYYTDKETVQDQRYMPLVRATGEIQPPELGGSMQPATYEELAVFGNVNLEITPTFDVSVGARFSDQNQSFEQIGRLVAPSLPFTTMEDEVSTYSADARWHVSPDAMIYARYATGFVPGGPNVAPFGVPPGTIPPTYESSTTTNYELGIKTTLLDNTLTLDLALFQIDWEAIQLSQAFGIYNAIANGGTAVSKGVEWAINYAPVEGLTLGFSGALTNARLTADAPNGGTDGERLPVTPELQTAVSADYEWPMFGVQGFVGADWRYVGDRFAEFTPGTRQELPSYSIVDLRTGIDTDSWRLGFFVKNVGDEEAISYVQTETAMTQQRVFVSTPRTIGVEFSTDF
jgi:iron complex outermembrane recepter protein